VKCCVCFYLALSNVEGRPLVLRLTYYAAIQHVQRKRTNSLLEISPIRSHEHERNDYFSGIISND
jgi:hypothetical protein